MVPLARVWRLYHVSPHCVLLRYILLLIPPRTNQNNAFCTNTEIIYVDAINVLENVRRLIDCYGTLSIQNNIQYEMTS